MKKALFTAAALTLAAISNSNTIAQTYSVNAVGYVNVEAPAGYSLIANPLMASASNNTVAKLFDPANVSPSLAVNSKIFVYDNPSGLFKTITFSPLSQSWSPIGDAATEILPGHGVFFFNNGAAPVNITFIGEVLQGNIKTPTPAGYSIIGTPAPKPRPPTQVVSPANPNDKIFIYNPASGI